MFAQDPKHFFTFVITATVMVLSACDRPEAEPVAPRTAPPIALPSQNPHVPPGHPALPSTPSPPTHTLSWSDPVGWVRTPPSSPMRIAQYTVPAGPNAHPAVLTVSHFPGMGGAIEPNLERWYGQFEPTDASVNLPGPRREDRTVNTLHVIIARARGRYSSGMPGESPTANTDNTDQGLLAAIVETPEGPWFFKLTGDNATVASAGPRFDDLLRSLRRR